MTENRGGAMPDDRGKAVTQNRGEAVTPDRGRAVTRDGAGAVTRDRAGAVTRDRGEAVTRDRGEAATQDRVLGDLLCFDLYSLSRLVTSLYRPVLEPHGLTYPQYLVLTVLTRLGTCSIGDIGRATRLDHGTLTPLLRRLADRDLITLDRSTTDARSVTVSLTKAGEALRPVLHEAYCHLGDSLGMTEQQVRRLQSTLHQLTDHLTPTT